MKKFSKILICFILCIFAFGLSACGKDSFYQSTATEVIGNGGMAVESNGYLYFVNGFISADDQTTKNATYTVGSLMVAKLVDGKLVLADDGYLDDDYLRTISSKLAGFEATSIYIFGDYLYFTSPCQENEQGGDWAKERVDFYRIKLDGTGSAKRIYQSSVDYDSLDFEYYYDGSNVYLIVYESGDSNVLYRINASTGKSTTISEDVYSYYLGGNSDYSDGDYSLSYVFYIESTDDGYSYNILNAVTGEIKSKDGSSAATVIYVNDSYAYYTITETNNSSNSLTYLYRAKITDGTLTAGVVIHKSSSSTYAISDDGYVIVVGTNTFIIISPTGAETSVEDSEATEITVIGFANGSIIYYDGDASLCYVSYSTPSVSGTIIEEIEDLSTSYFCITNNYIYYYATVNENEYLFRVSVFGGDSELVGVYDEADVPETEDEDDEEDEDE